MNQTADSMDRITLCAETFRRLFERQPTTNEGNDPEFMQIMQRYIFGEIWHKGSLSDPVRALCEVTAMTARHTLPALKNHIRSAFNARCTAVQIREAVYLCAPFTGFPHVMEACVVMNEVFAEKGIQVPLPNTRTIEKDTTRLNVGKSLFPDKAENFTSRFATLPQPYDEFIPYILTAYGFGDFGSRNGLIRKERELLCIVAIVCSEINEDLLKLHGLAAMDAGATMEEIVCALVQASPYMGLGRLLTSLELLKLINQSGGTLL